jgi:hypothetical protein
MKFFLAVAIFLTGFSPSAFSSQMPPCLSKKQPLPNNPGRLLAMLSKGSGGQVLVTGEVTELLKDDNKGLKHQRFVITVEGRRVMVVSNLDSVSRIPLTMHSPVTVCGELLGSRNRNVPVIHWTHYTRGNRGHPEGFIYYFGTVYGLRPGR